MTRPFRNLPMNDMYLVECNDMTRTLIARLKKEYESYVGEITKDDKNAMMCHPFMAYHGMHVLVKNTNMLTTEQHASLKEEFVSLVSTFIKLEPSNDNVPVMNADDSTIINDNEDSQVDSDDFFNIQDIYGENHLTTMPTLAESKIDLAQSEVNKYINYCTTMDWEETIINNPTVQLKNDQERATKDGNQEEWRKKFKGFVNTKNIIQLWQYFDLLGWWKTFGKMNFPNIAMAAAITLARPYTNASQERDFSMATWFDGNLFQNQKPEKLERRLLLGLNRQVVEVIKSEITEIQEKNLSCQEKTILPQIPESVMKNLTTSPLIQSMML
jgi:hAT family C-terminal dimerisation region